MSAKVCSTAPYSVLGWQRPGVGSGRLTMPAVERPVERKQSHYHGNCNSVVSPQISGHSGHDVEVTEARGCERSNDSANGFQTIYRPNVTSAARLQWNYCNRAGFAVSEAERQRHGSVVMPPSPSQVPPWRCAPVRATSPEPLDPPVRRPQQEVTAAADHTVARDHVGHRDETAAVLGSPHPDARAHLYLSMMRSPISPQPSWSPLSPKSTRMPMSPQPMPTPDRCQPAQHPMHAATFFDPSACRAPVERQPVPSPVPSSAGGSFQPGIVDLGHERRTTTVTRLKWADSDGMGCLQTNQCSPNQYSPPVYPVFPQLQPDQSINTQFSKTGNRVSHALGGACLTRRGAGSFAPVPHREPPPMLPIGKAVAQPTCIYPSQSSRSEGTREFEACSSMPSFIPAAEGSKEDNVIYTAVGTAHSSISIRREAHLSMPSLHHRGTAGEGTVGLPVWGDLSHPGAAQKKDTVLHEASQAHFSLSSGCPRGLAGENVVQLVRSDLTRPDVNPCKEASPCEPLQAYASMPSLITGEHRAPNPQMPSLITGEHSAPNPQMDLTPHSTSNKEGHSWTLSFCPAPAKENNSCPAKENSSENTAQAVQGELPVSDVPPKSEVAKYKCVACGTLLDNKEEAAYHCTCPATDIFKYRCPGCGALMDTCEEAFMHCSDVETGSTKSSDGDDQEMPASATPASATTDATPTSATTPKSSVTASVPVAGSTAATEAVTPDVSPMPQGEPVAYDDRGQPIIVRQVDGQTGKVRTVVRNEDGIIRAFGETTVSSLADSEEQDAKRWVDGLSDRELRALVHEVGHRLLWNSKQYECHQAQLEKIVDASNYTYFGLPVGAPEKALDNAYRKFAKKMHPDKNGGTEEAKQRFQHMKERYEALKTRRNAAPEESKEGKKDEEQTEDGHGAEDAESEGEERNKACDNDDVVDRQQQQKGESKSTIEYDPNDRGSLHKTVWRMLNQLKTMQRGLQDLEKQLGRANAQTAYAAAGSAAASE